MNQHCEWLTTTSAVAHYHVIVPLPDDLLSAIKLASGDKLDLEVKPNGTIILTPVRT